MIYARWSEEAPEGFALGVEVVRYTPFRYEWGEPGTELSGILPSYEGEEFNPQGFQTPHYMGVWGVLEGLESLKFVKTWPKEARLEAGRFLRHVWQGVRSLRERGILV